jgi:hypothetical protein
MEMPNALEQEGSDMVIQPAVPAPVANPAPFHTETVCDITISLTPTDGSPATTHLIPFIRNSAGTFMVMRPDNTPSTQSSALAKLSINPAHFEVSIAGITQHISQCPLTLEECAANPGLYNGIKHHYEYPLNTKHEVNYSYTLKHYDNTSLLGARLPVFTQTEFIGSLRPEEPQFSSRRVKISSRPAHLPNCGNYLGTLVIAASIRNIIINQ